MNSNRRQGKRPGMIATTLALLTAVIMSAGVAIPAHAQTLPVAFPAPTTLAVGCPTCGSSPVSVATGDFNGDGKLDVVNLDSGSNLNTMFGKGDGTFQAPVTTYIGFANYFPDAIAVGDFNGDHLLDVAVWATNSTTSNTEVHVYLGNGTGAFTTGGVYSAPNSNTFNPGPNSIVAVDVNGDGKLDLVGLTILNGIFVFLGNGDGTFQAPAVYSTGTTNGCCSGLAVGDLNGDGKPDLAISANDGISILLNSGTGTFGAATYYPSGVAGSATGDGIAIGDLNGDKHPDVVVTDENFGAIVYLNQGTGTFKVNGTVGGGLFIYGTNNVVLADINNDKKLDIVIPDGIGDVFTFYGKGNGTFTAGPMYPLQAQNSGDYLVAVGDFNGDGALDLLNTNGFNTITLSLGRGDGSFQTNQLYAYNTTLVANNIATADFNGDGFPDTAQSLTGGKIGINLGSSHGVLGTATTAVASTCANNAVEWVATGDVNGDGKADIVATLQGASFTGCQLNKVAVLEGLGTGHFKTAAYYSTGAASTAQEGIVYLVDVNGDGKLDIVTDNSDGTISVLVNKGTGTYSAGVVNSGMVSINPLYNNLAFADFNGDGKMDIAVATRGSVNAVYVLLGNGNGTFGAPILTSTPFANYPVSLAAGDFNKDGKADLVMTTTAGCCNTSFYAFLKGNGDGTFTAGSLNTVPYDGPLTPVVADLNGDGNLDLVIPYQSGLPARGPAVLQGNGDGTFTALPIFYAGESAYSAVVADFNGDGMPDIALLNSNNFTTDYITVMFNATKPVSVSPLNENFGSVTVGMKKGASVILTNNQSKSLAITSMTLTGTNASDFSETNNCGATRKAHWDCTITVDFTPTATGTRTATLNITDAVGTQTVQLTGTGK